VLTDIRVHLETFLLMSYVYYKLGMLRLILTATPLFQTGGQDMPCAPTFFSLGFVFGEVSKRKVMFVMFCVIDELFMLDGRPHIAMLMLKQSLMWYH